MHTVRQIPGFKNLAMSQTQAYFMNPSGRSPQSVGIMPEITVNDPIMKDLPAYRSKDTINALPAKWFEVKRDPAYMEKVDSVRSCVMNAGLEATEFDDDQLTAALYTATNCL